MLQLNYACTCMNPYLFLSFSSPLSEGLSQLYYLLYPLLQASLPPTSSLLLLH